MEAPILPDSSIADTRSLEIEKGIENQADFGEPAHALCKSSIDTALNAELYEHIGYETQSTDGGTSGDSCNGHCHKRFNADQGEVEIEIPRDHDGGFGPQRAAGSLTYLPEIDGKVLYVRAEAMNTRDIVTAFKELYDSATSARLISKITERVIELVPATGWPGWHLLSLL